MVTSPFTIIRVGLQRSGIVVQRYEAQNRNVETETQAREVSDPPGKVSVVLSDPGKRIVVLLDVVRDEV